MAKKSTKPRQPKADRRVMAKTFTIGNGMRDIAQAAEQTSKICDQFMADSQYWTYIKYVKDLARAKATIWNIRDAIQGDWDNSQDLEVWLNDDTPIYETLSDSVELIIERLDNCFSECDLYKENRKLIHARLWESSMAVINAIEQELWIADFTDLSAFNTEDGGAFSKFLIHVCEDVFPKPDVVITPPPATVKVTTTELQRLARVWGNKTVHGTHNNFFQRVLGMDVPESQTKRSRASRLEIFNERIEFPVCEEPDDMAVLRWQHPKQRCRHLDTHFQRFAVMNEEFVAEYSADRDSKSHSLYQHFKKLNEKKEIRDRLGYRAGYDNEFPVVIDSLNERYISAQTRSILHIHGYSTIWGLVTFDDDNATHLANIPSLGDARIMELQMAFAELGIYRHEHDTFRPGKPQNPLEVDALSVSPMDYMLKRVPYIDSNLEGEDLVEAPLKDVLLSDYHMQIGERSRHETGEPDEWIVSLPGVDDKKYEKLFGVDIEFQDLASFHQRSFTELVEITDSESPKEIKGFGFFPSDKTKLLMEFIKGYAAFKSVYGQDEKGMSFYDNEYGHMPWMLTRTDLAKGMDWFTDFGEGEQYGDCAAAPMSVYSPSRHAQAYRDHPRWYKRRVEDFRP